ncbi:MAG: hypothetical protein ACYC6O_02980 [Thermoleophilia bacterium]
MLTPKKQASHDAIAAASSSDLISGSTAGAAPVASKTSTPS